MTKTETTAPAAGTFPWTVEELEGELAETREAWKIAKILGEATAAIERAGFRLRNEIEAAKANGGWILL